MPEPAQNTNFPYLHTIAGVILSVIACFILWALIGNAIVTWMPNISDSGHLILFLCGLFPIGVVEYINILLAKKAKKAQKLNYSRSYNTIAVITFIIYGTIALFMSNMQG